MGHKLTLDRDAIPDVLEAHRVVLTADETGTLLGGHCTCTFETNWYQHPRTWWYEDPTREKVRRELYEHIIKVLTTEAGWQ
jgi:hypothetical protein